MCFRKKTKPAYSAVEPPKFYWRPGVAQIPLLGLGALLISVAGIVTSIAILLASNGVDVRHWKYQPTVYISIASTVTNITLAFALSEGVGISWWYKALRDGTRVQDLHRVWAFGNSFISAITGVRHLSLAAVACILVAISPINGPLLQRASTITTADVQSIQQLKLGVAKLVPKGYTGLISSRIIGVNMLTTNFSPIARSYYSKSDITMHSGCTGSCRTTVQGAGLLANCTSYEAPYNVSADLSKLHVGTDVFAVNFEYEVSVSATKVAMNIQYKPSAGCVGELVARNCTLYAGTVLYPVVMDGASSTVSLEPGSTIWDDVVIGDLDSLPAEDTNGGLSTYGGIFLTIANQYTTDLSLAFAGAVGDGWEIVATQSEVALAYARGVGDYVSCNISFEDPTADLLQGMRELMFRTAVASGNDNDAQNVTALSTGTHTIYHTSYLFLSLATLASILPLTAILLTFRGFQHLGRKVSMSPIETGKAFNAPILRNSSSNAPVRSLLEQVGTRPIKYGVVSGGSSRRPVARVDDMIHTQSNVRPDNQQNSSYSPDTTRGGPPQTAIAPTMLAQQSAATTGYDNQVEMRDQRGNSEAPVVWLELADPKRTAPITNNVTFRG